MRGVRIFSQGVLFKHHVDMYHKLIWSGIKVLRLEKNVFYTSILIHGILVIIFHKRFWTYVCMFIDYANA